MLESLPTFNQSIAMKWQFVNAADNEAVASVIIGQSPVSQEIITVLNNYSWLLWEL